MKDKNEKILKRYMGIRAKLAPGSGASPSEIETAQKRCTEMERKYGITAEDIAYYETLHGSGSSHKEPAAESKKTARPKTEKQKSSKDNTDSTEYEKKKTDQKQEIKRKPYEKEPDPGIAHPDICIRKLVQRARIRVTADGESSWLTGPGRKEPVDCTDMLNACVERDRAINNLIKKYGHQNILIQGDFKDPCRIVYIRTAGSDLQEIWYRIEDCSYCDTGNIWRKYNSSDLAKAYR